MFLDFKMDLMHTLNVLLVLLLIFFGYSYFSTPSIVKTGKNNNVMSVLTSSRSDSLIYCDNDKKNCLVGSTGTDFKFNDNNTFSCNEKVHIF